jgi:hypothetical protein
VTKNKDESDEDSFMISWSESYGSSREPFLEKQTAGNVQDLYGYYNNNDALEIIWKKGCHQGKHSEYEAGESAANYSR